MVGQVSNYEIFLFIDADFFFRYAYSWSRETEVKTAPNRDRGESRPRPRPRPNSDLNRMVCQKLERDWDRPNLQRMYSFSHLPPKILFLALLSF